LVEETAPPVALAQDDQGVAVVGRRAPDLGEGGVEAGALLGRAHALAQLLVMLLVDVDPPAAAAGVFAARAEALEARQVPRNQDATGTDYAAALVRRACASCAPPASCAWPWRASSCPTWPCPSSSRASWRARSAPTGLTPPRRCPRRAPQAGPGRRQRARRP